MTFSEPLPSHTAVGAVATNSVAYAEGLRESDEILKVNDAGVADWYDILSEDLLTKAAGTVDITFRSGTETKVISLESEATLTDMYPARYPLIAKVRSKSAAKTAGLEAGDMVTALDGKPIMWWHELSDALQELGDRKTSITVQRKDETITMDITPKLETLKDEETGEESTRVLIGVEVGDPGMLAWTMEGNVFQQVKSDGSKIFRLIQALSKKEERGSAAAALGGPISIFAMIWFALKLGFLYAIGLVRFININLAVLNLLPLPVLDGGHICFALWEGVTKRKVHPKVVATLVNVFAILLITAMILLSWRDSDRFWGISRFFKKAPIEQAEPPAEP